jgi:AcrR family transcriptional regulator
MHSTAEHASVTVGPAADPGAPEPAVAGTALAGASAPATPVARTGKTRTAVAGTAGSRTAVAGTAVAGTAVPAPRRPGRPRSEVADQAIIAAALEVFAECGPDGLGIEQVAARAGVGKATIYRRWPGKEQLLLDAIGTLRTPLPQPQGRSVRSDLTALIEALCKEAADPRRARQFALLHGDGARYPRLLAKYNQTVVEPRRELIRSVLRRGVATGELRESTDVDAAMFLLSGAVLTRGALGAQVSDARYARRVVEELLRGLAAR